MTSNGRLLFYSKYAFYRPLYEVFRILCAEYAVEGYVITHENPAIPRVYAPEGYLTASAAGLGALPENIWVIPQNASDGEKVERLRKWFLQADPDWVWAHEEPVDYFVSHMLRWAYFQKRPRVAIAAVENMWPEAGGVRGAATRVKRRLLWRRYNAVLGAATKSIEAVRRIGMPRSVPAVVAWLPHLSPPPTNGALPNLPTKRPGDVFVGFAGRICAAKGWRVLLEAMKRLPTNVHCLLVGSGEEETELAQACAKEPLQGRAHFLGLLEKEKLWAFYRALDMLVLPSVSTREWSEQFGSVLAEAMACGVAVIGSRSGAIPEVVGDAGLLVEENDPDGLAEAIAALASDPEERARRGRLGMDIFAKEYSCAAYAQKVARALKIEKR